MLIDGFLASLLVTLAAVGFASFCLTFTTIMGGTTEVDSRVMVSTILGTFLVAGFFAFAMEAVSHIHLW